MKYFVRSKRDGELKKGWSYESLSDATKCAEIIYRFEKAEVRILERLGITDIKFDVEVCSSNIIGATSVHSKASLSGSASSGLMQSDFDFIDNLFERTLNTKEISSELVIPDNKLIAGPLTEEIRTKFSPRLEFAWRTCPRSSTSILDIYLCTFGKWLGEVENSREGQSINFFVHPDLGVVGQNDDCEWRLFSVEEFSSLMSDPKFETEMMSPKWHSIVEQMLMQSIRRIS